MPLNISSDGIVEKNKLNQTGIWYLLIKIEYTGETPGYVCLNNESVTWEGNEYLPAIFSLSGLSESKDTSVPSTTLSIVDMNRTLIPLLEDYDGGVGATLTLYIVHSDHLDNSTPELEMVFEVLSVFINWDYTVTFRLGSENLINRRIPKHRYLKNTCRFIFKGSLCQYGGGETECDRTFARCTELSNQTRFGGFPGIGALGIQI